jgi:nicotinamide phosphoribosyltransferase
MKILPVLLSDSYKQLHHLMYPKNMTKLYSNMTARKSRLDTDGAIWFGLNYYIKEYLINQWNELFFDRPIEDIVKEYKRFHKYFSSMNVSTKHIEELYELGYLPILIKALPEGSWVNIRVPFYTITNTHEDFAWLVNFLETQMSTVIWDLTTVATISYQYRLLLSKYALQTIGSTDGVQWQAHDFSQRGRSSTETTQNQAGHLLSFTGTDTIPAVLMLEEYYSANMENELIGASVPASEHSIATSFGKENELESFIRILDQFPTGIVSMVSDSYDLWQVCTEFMPKLKEKILAREGKAVLRPDSGDPVDIICGRKVVNSEDIEDLFNTLDNCYSITNNYYALYDDTYYEFDIYEWEGGGFKEYEFNKEVSLPAVKGVIELLWDVFGGIVNEQGYKVLDSHIGAIYGDSITLKRAEEICQRLKAKGFASTNIVLGIGSYTFNYQTRDSLGIAVKSTYCEISHITEEDMQCQGGPSLGETWIESREIFKDPITDDGTKKSAKGLLRIDKDRNGDFYLTDQVTQEQEEGGELIPVFEDGELLVDPTLAEIRTRINKNIIHKLNELSK